MLYAASVSTGDNSLTVIIIVGALLAVTALAAFFLLRKRA